MLLIKITQRHSTLLRGGAGGGANASDQNNTEAHFPLRVGDGAG
jgi:hypothetical protein